MRPLRCFVVLACLLPPAVAAQATGSIAGRVIDSLVTGGPLRGAVVRVGVLDRVATTDSLGRFRIDGMPTGRWVLDVTHAALDSARLRAPSVRADVLEGETVDVVLGTPAPQTLYARACPDPRPAGSAVLFGSVTSAEAPAVGGAVRVFWREWSLRPGAEPEEVPREANFVLDESGRFSICGVPADRLVTVAAALEARTGQTEVRLDGRAAGFVRLDLVAAGGAAPQVAAVEPDADGITVVDADSRTVAPLRGAVVDGDGRPVGEARVTLVGTPATATTRTDGSFQFVNVPRAVQTVEVAALGFVPRRVEVDLRPGRQRRADVVLERVAYVLKPINTQGSRDPQLLALERRLRAGNGQFLTAAQIRERRAISVSDLLKGMNGITVRSNGMGLAVLMNRAPGNAGRSLGGQCVPAFYVDGSVVGSETRDPTIDSLFNSTVAPLPIGGQTAAGTNAVGGVGVMPRDIGPDQFVQVGDIEVIEVYTSATQVPPEFATFRGACGLVAIWTRRGAGPRIIEDAEP